MYRRASMLVLFCCWATLGFCQKTLTLEECLKIAVENNIQVQLAKNSVESAQLSYVQKKFDFLPSVNANLQVNKSIGKAVDPFTQQIAQSPWNVSPNLTASFTAFRGFVKWNDLHNTEQTLLANQYTLEDLKNDIRLSIALAYFQVVFAIDNLQIAKNRLELLNKQLDKVQKELLAGSKTQGDVYNVKAQVATEKLNVINQENNYDRSLLDLILTMNIDPRVEYSLVRPAMLEITEEMESLESIFDEAKLNNPGIRKQAFKAFAAEYAVKSARASFFPTLNLSYGLTSIYSSQRKEIIITYVNGQPVYEIGPVIPMFTQFNDYFSQSIALSLTVPIFNRLQTRQSYLISKVNHNSALLNLEAEQIDLYKSVQQAYLDATASKAKYTATQEQLESLNEAYRYAEAKYKAGLLDFYNFMDILNNKTKAELELVQAQYDQILKRKILDLYQGKPMNF